MRIVITHGRDQAFQIPGTLERAWTDAVRFGLQRVEFPHPERVGVDFAFYGDIWRVDYPGRKPAAGDDEDADRGFGTRSEDSVVRAAEGPPSELVRAVAAELSPGAAPGPGADVEAERSWDDVARIVRVLDSRLGVGKAVLAWFLKDLDEYFKTATVRDDVKERLTKKVRDANDDVILLGHSMGSIVAYDLMADGVAGNLRIRSLLTFGSPLGMKSVRDRMDTLHQGTPYPNALDKWVNVFNRQDFATVVRELRPLYGDVDELEDVEALGKDPRIVDPGSGHDPLIYLSSIGLATALRTLLSG
jgi:pimeloyl-ACP methyl ester carboxylesterase